MILFLLCRIPWQIINNMLEDTKYDEAMFVVNRLAHSFFLFAYSITLFYWYEIFNSIVIAKD